MLTATWGKHFSRQMLQNVRLKSWKFAIRWNQLHHNRFLRKQGTKVQNYISALHGMIP